MFFFPQILRESCFFFFWLRSKVPLCGYRYSKCCLETDFKSRLLLHFSNLAS